MIRQLKTWSDTFLASLALVNEHPDLVNVVGLMAFSSCRFAANAKIYANFTGKKANTVNWGFRTHRIKKADRLPLELRRGLADPSHWKIHIAVDDLFRSNQQETFRFERVSRRGPGARRSPDGSEVSAHEVRADSSDFMAFISESESHVPDWSMEFDEFHDSQS
jgi:hypothetical protein